MNSSKDPSELHVCSFVYDEMPKWESTYLTIEVSASLISISAINLLVSPCTMLSNILVMIAVKTSPRLRNNCNLLLASLAGTDLMTAAIGQPLLVVEQIYRLTGSFDSYSVCVLKFVSGISANTSVITSIQHLALLSIERYIAITNPYKYPELITVRRLIVSAVSAWSVAALLAVLIALYTVNTVFTSIFRNFIIVTSISILIFCQIAVYREARNQMIKIKIQQISVEAKEIFLKEKKAFNTTTMVIGVVLFSFIPLILFRLVLKPLLSSPAMKFVMEYACRSIMFCNSVCNPLIYCVRNREFRRAFRKLLFTRSQPEVQPT